MPRERKDESFVAIRCGLYKVRPPHMNIIKELSFVCLS